MFSIELTYAQFCVRMKFVSFITATCVVAFSVDAYLTVDVVIDTSDSNLTLVDV
jgi:hypothetical protein